MKISKSSRHSKITGDFAESLVLYWLSKYGFECALIDHTGIDIIANNPHTNEVMGISVKSRSRTEGTESTTIRIDSDQCDKVTAACEAFRCNPYFAIVVDVATKIKVFILRMEHLQQLFLPAKSISWRMSKKWLEIYKRDPEIKIIEFEHTTERWW